MAFRYVSTFAQNNPTYEFYPKTDNQSHYMDFLNYTVPVNLFPLSWLMPGGEFIYEAHTIILSFPCLGKLFMQAAYKTILYDLDAQQETPLPDMPYAVRVYPASAATALLPLTPANNYSATVLFCGGSAANFNLSSDGGAQFNVTAVPADNTCVRISPEDEKPTYEDDDYMLEGRSMGQFILMPDGKMWMGNGCVPNQQQDLQKKINSRDLALLWEQRDMVTKATPLDKVMDKNLSINPQFTSELQLSAMGCQ